MAAVVCLFLSTVRSGSAEEDASRSKLLELDGPMVEISALERENLHGLGVQAGGLVGHPVDFGVILWDEVKPGQPSPPPSSQGMVGQGSITIKATSN